MPTKLKLADRLIPGWAFKEFGLVALALAVTLPVGAALSGWLDAEPPEAASEELGQALRPRLVRLPGGTFLMGSPDGDEHPQHVVTLFPFLNNDGEHPQHEVTLSPFAMCETEVTVAQYRAVTGEEPRICDDNECEDDHPVHGVSWEDAVRYLNELTRLENRAREAAGLPELTRCYDEETWAWERECTGYRLPTEAQWEYAARAGTTTKWSFGDDESKICEYGQVESCEGGGSDGKVVGVKTKKANDWGLYGVHGNVWEWVFDEYDSRFYKESEGVDPDNDKNDKENDTGNDVRRVLCGGSFDDSAGVARSAVRNGLYSRYLSRFVGFRCSLGPRPQHGTL